MKIIIQKAKNGEDTACAEGHFLHSNYAPVKEAQRFVENLKLPYQPSSIIITEPGLSYCAEFLRKTFPFIKIGAIRYSDSFCEYDKYFDFVLNYYDAKDFESYLESKLSEEELLKVFFIAWPASSQIFKEEDKIVWEAIKAALERSKTLLITRQYFEKKWFINSCRFLSLVSKTVELNLPVNKAALIISSGPSLIPFINYIRENQTKFYIICLSSAISVCLANGIKPDLCMSTDGGYWAGEHLKVLKNADIPLALPAEAYCSKELLSKLTILPLDYGDGISSQLLSHQNFKCMKAVRNGTVSGTALLFAASYCTKDIFLCGLDMASQKGFQHTQPNQLEINASLHDSKTSSKFTRLTRSELTNGSMDIYKDWFCKTPLNLKGRKVYRLIEEIDRKNTLGWIKDISLSEFSSISKAYSDSSPVDFNISNCEKKADSLSDLFSDTAKTEQWKKQLFPLDYVLLSHNPDNSEVIEKIEREWSELKNKAEEILNEII